MAAIDTSASVPSIIRKAIRSRFVRDGATLVSGTMLSQLVTIGTAPVMARLYDPAAYGLLGLFIAVYGMVTISATLQYQAAVILPADDGDAMALVKGGVYLGLITTCLILVISLLPLRSVLSGTGYEAIVRWIPLMAIMALPNAFTAFGTGWLCRKQQFHMMSVSRIVTNVVSMVVGLALGFSVGADWGLLAGNTLGLLAGAAVIWYGMRASGGLEYRHIPFSNVFAQFRKFKKFPLLAAPNDLLSQTANQTPIFLLTGFIGTQAVGFYNMSNRLLGLPNSILGESISTVFSQRAAKQYAEHGECAKLYRQMFWGLVSITVPGITILAITAPVMFAIVLGEKWRIAGEYSQILCWLFGFKLICSPLSVMMTIAHRQAEDLVVQVMRVVILSLSVWCANAFFGTTESMLIAFTAASSLAYLYYGARGWALSKGRPIRAGAGLPA